MRHSRKIFVVLAQISVVCAIVIGSHGCSQKPAQMEKVRVRLGWQINANSAGQLAALDNGFFREEGLDVDIQSGGLDNPSVKTLAAGSDDIGFANGPDLVISARAAGIPLKIVAVVQQRSYHAFFVREESGIFTPKDWEGRRVGVKYSSPTYLLYQMLLNRLGVDRSKIKEIPLEYSLQSFLDGKIDVYPGATTNEAISLEMVGLKLRTIHPSTYGVNTCGNVIFTTDKMIAERPEVVRRFVRAVLRGWEWSLKPENQAAAVGILLKHSDRLKQEKEARALAMNSALILPGEITARSVDSLVAGALVDSVPFTGWINRARLESLCVAMKQFGALDSAFSVSDVYTDQFLPTHQK